MRALVSTRRPPRPHAAARSPGARPLHVAWAVIVCTALAFSGLRAIAGVSITGLAWSIPLALAVLDLATTPGRVSLPIAVWVPWIVTLLAYLPFAEVEHALQRSVMMLCPLVIGATLSRRRVTDEHLAAFNRAYRWLAVALILATLTGTGMLVTGQLPGSTGLAAPVMTGALLCTLFAAEHASGTPRALAWWGALALVPVVGLTRMGLLATGLSLPLTLAPLRPRVRLVLFAAVLVAGYALFNTDRVQRKSFHSGAGTIADVGFHNGDFATSGRARIWDAMRSEIEERPWFGHGANASERFVSSLTGGLVHPHNDWLRLLYDYGWVGTGAFVLGMLAQVIHLLRSASRSSGRARSLLYAGASSFLLVPLFMISDNIVLYAPFFGSLQFTVIGLAYAAAAATARAEPR